MCNRVIDIIYEFIRPYIGFKGDTEGWNKLNIVGRGGHSIPVEMTPMLFVLIEQINNFIYIYIIYV